MKSAMTELKDKLQVVVDELADAKPQTDQYGYREAMQNVIKDIDAQMLEKERQQIIDAFDTGFYNGDDWHEPHEGETYFTTTFTQ